MGKYDKFKDIDFLNVEEVVKAIKLALDTDEFESNEERLYAIGWVVDRNKDMYINKLKRDLESEKTKTDGKIKSLDARILRYEKRIENYEIITAELRNELKELKKEAKESVAPVQTSSPTKKVYVVRRKPTL
jgi:hypothetical protein